MRTLLLSAVIAWSGMIAQANAMNLAPKVGDSVTQSQLLGYLFVPPQSGNWLRYRITVDDYAIMTKTIGFGRQQIGDDERAFFETQTQSAGLIGAPVDNRTVAGGSVAWKMFVDAPTFDDPLRQYAFVGGVMKIGDALFRLGIGPGKPLPATSRSSLQSLLLFGTLPVPDDRSGVVVSSSPQDVEVQGTSLHCVHTTVDFAAHDTGMANGLPQARLETWQTTDVPLGIVTIRTTTNGHVYTVALTAYGESAFRSVIDKPLDSIPLFPG